MRIVRRAARRRRGDVVLLVLAAALAATVLLRGLPPLASAGGGSSGTSRVSLSVDASSGSGGGGTPAFKGLESVRGSELLFVTFANAAFFDFLLNWSRSVARLGVPFFAGALDADCAAKAAAAGLPHGLLSQELVTGPGSANFRQNLTRFRGMGALKVQLVTTLLADHGVKTLVVSDTDTVWLRSPSDYLAKHPLADWFISTDCLSHEVEAAGKPRHNNPRCGHVPGNHWGRALNSGVFVLRNRPAVLAALRRWHAMLTDPEHAVKQWSATSQSVITDQLALTMVLSEGSGGESRSVSPDEPRTIWQANDTLRLHPLPVSLFPGGHVAFVQRTPWKLGLEPYVVHATFTRFSYTFQYHEKIGRFRELGMWLLDPPSYYQGRFLTYANDVLQFVDSVEQQRHGGAMPPLYKMWLGQGYQNALFHEALAVAALTNRTVVLPQSWAWCDYDHTPHVLETCRIRGTEGMRLPFQAPADFVFHTTVMDWQPGLDYRLPNFLELPQVPGSIRSSRKAAAMQPRRPASGTRPPEGSAAVLWPGMAEKELVEALQPTANAAVLELRGLRPGLVAGFADQQRASAFEAMFRNISREGWWCCGGVRMATDKMVFRYPLPRPLTEPWKPYEPPEMQLPPYCKKKDVTAENLEYVGYANHPCSFLLNGSAWRVASELGRT